MNMFDKRIELLEGLALAVKLKDKTVSKEAAESIDFVEYNDIPYVNELLGKIDVEKYSELKKYILDIKDCAYYTNLYLYFDNEFNYKKNCNLEVFNSKNISDFTNLVKKIYDSENIEQVFAKYYQLSIKISRVYNDIYKFDKQKIREEYSLLFNVPEEVTFDSKITILANGGFSTSNGNELACIKGIGDNLKVLKYKKEYSIVNLYHEFAHYFVNPIVDKNIKVIPNKDFLLQEAIDNNLPKTYQNINSVYMNLLLEPYQLFILKAK